MTDKSVQFSSVARSCLTLCNPMDCSTPGPPFHHQLPEFIQTHVHWVGDANQSSHPLLSPSVIPFSSHFQSFPASGSFPMRQFFASGGQSISFSISPSNEYSELTDRSISTKPWFSICKLNDSTRDVRTVPRHYLKTKEGVAPQLLEWTSHSLAHEITQLGKTNCTTVHGHHNSPLPWPIPCGVCFFLNPNKFTSYLSLCLSLNFFFFFFFFSMRCLERELH